MLREVLSEGSTVLLVAHNLKSVETADRIIFIENGEVVEEGTHHQLLAKGGRYNHFYRTCNVPKVEPPPDADASGLLGPRQLGS